MADPTKLHWLNEDQDQALEAKLTTELNANIEQADTHKIQAVVDILKNPDASFLEAHKRILREFTRILEASNPNKIPEAKKLLETKSRAGNPPC